MLEGWQWCARESAHEKCADTSSKTHRRHGRNVFPRRWRIAGRQIQAKQIQARG